jgi:UDP-N-acetylglucosamine 1-carboxyvinyltransferase
MSLFVLGRQAARSGIVQISGAKNSIMPIAMASLMVDGEVVLRNVPENLADVRAARSILEHLGAKVEMQDRVMRVSTADRRYADVSRELAEGTRYSSLLFGIMLRVFGRAYVGSPGGCRIGDGRPLDIHYAGMRAFGAELTHDNEAVIASLPTEHGGTFRLRYPSVGATENLILFSVIGSHRRVIQNCACEPEIEDLIGFLNACGAKISGGGTEEIVIEGVSSLQGTDWTIMPDRIEAGTFALLAPLIEHDMIFGPVRPDHLSAVFDTLSRLGIDHDYDVPTQRLQVAGSVARRHLRPIDQEARPYPGFPTDLHPVLAALCLKANGTSTIIDTVFPDRFAYIAEFKRLGAHLHRRQNAVGIDYSYPRLRGTHVRCHDIRAGVACLMAALIAEGASTIDGELQIARGYDGLPAKLEKLGLRVDHVCDDEHDEIAGVRCNVWAKLNGVVAPRSETVARAGERYA